MNIYSLRQPSLRFLFLLLLAGAVLLGACRPTVVVEGEPPPTATMVTPTQAPTEEPTSTPIPVPAGDEANPLVMALVSEAEDPAMLEAGIALAAQLAERSGLSVQAQMYPTYQEVMNGFQNGEVHIAWLPPLTYLNAKRSGLAGAALLTNHFGVYNYGTQFFANTADNYTLYFDSGANASTGDAAEALQQFAGKRPCWTEPSSASGYIVPQALLQQNAVETLEPVLAQTYTSVLRALYVKGICDFGATYSVSGDPRTASNMSDLPNLMENVVVIWQSDPVIPNLNVSFLSSMGREMREPLAQAFLDIAAGEEGLLLISTATAYDVQALKAVDDSEYDALRELVDLVQPDPGLVMGK